MKAMVYTNYGPPDVLQLQEVERPTPKDHEVLLRVHATTATSAEGMMRRGDTLISRLVLGLLRPRKKFRILGLEMAGEIVAVGRDVERFGLGDQVYGFAGFDPGALAEYKCMPETASLARKPSNLSYEQAAAAVDGATTALFFLKDKGDIQPGQRVLINGASGSIGTYAIQLAKYFGAHVTGVCSGRNVELVASLGADRVIDYTQDDFTAGDERYDLIFDTVAKSSFSRCKRVLTKRGRYLVTAGSMLMCYVRTLWSSLVGGKRFVFAMSVEKNEALRFLRGLFEEETLVPVIDRTYTMEEAPEAHAYVETGRKRGNVVITIPGTE